MMCGNTLLAMPGSGVYAPDIKKRAYCGIKCNMECILLKGTVYNDEDLKRKAYDEWKMNERYEVDFNPEEMVCYGCKNDDQPPGYPVQRCTARKCAIGKGYEGCIQCRSLADCEDELWMSFPQFRERVLELQDKYFTG
jgi:hypothetical protein